MRARQVAAIAVATVLLAVGSSAPAVAHAPSARLGVGFAPGSPAPPVLQLPYTYAIDVGNDGDVPLDSHAATASVLPSPADPQPPSDPPVPSTVQELAVGCSHANLVLLRAAPVGRQVRFRGAANPDDAGQRVRIRGMTRGQSGFSESARTTVRPDGLFEATGPLPSSVGKMRYFAQLGDRRSPALKLTRRLRASLTADAETVTISGRATPPLATPIRDVVIRRLTSCVEGYDVVARVRPTAGGRLRVTLPRTSGPALYLADTRVRSKLGRPMRTFSFVLWTA